MSLPKPLKPHCRLPAKTGEAVCLAVAALERAIKAVRLAGKLLAAPEATVDLFDVHEDDLTLTIEVVELAQDFVGMLWALDRVHSEFSAVMPVDLAREMMRERVTRQYEKLPPHLRKPDDPTAVVSAESTVRRV